MAVALAGAEHRRGEAGMVGAVGEVLGFERQRSAAAVGFAALADQGAVEEITAVELDARFGRPNLHITPRSGFIDRSRQLQVMGAPARQHPIVVVAVAVAELFEIGIEARPDRCGRRKSIGVPSTGIRRPVGMSVESTGVKKSAAIISSWSLIGGPPAPCRLKNEWCVRLTTVRRSVVASCVMTKLLSSVSS